MNSFSNLCRIMEKKTEYEEFVCDNQHFIPDKFLDKSLTKDFAKEILNSNDGFYQTSFGKKMRDIANSYLTMAQIN